MVAERVETRAHLALSLLLYTGQRRSDVVRMGRQHRAGDQISVRQQKTGKTLIIPLHPKLKRTLDAMPNEQLTYLMTQLGKPFSAAGFTGWFVDRVAEAGLPPGLTPHGLRKAAARRLAEAGCTPHQIMAITGHQSLKEVERYTKAFDQVAMASAAIARLK